MRWINATLVPNTGDVWINMAAVFSIQRYPDDTTVILSIDGQSIVVKETPEHLVAPFR